MGKKTVALYCFTDNGPDYDSHVIFVADIEHKQKLEKFCDLLNKIRYGYGNVEAKKQRLLESYFREEGEKAIEFIEPLLPHYIVRGGTDLSEEELKIHFWDNALEGFYIEEYSRLDEKDFTWQ